MSAARNALFLIVALMPLVACNVTPSSRTNAESTDPVTLSGYVLSPGQTVSFQATDQNTGNLVSQGSTTAASTGFDYKTPGGAAYTLYPWTFNAGTLPANFWAPQPISPDLATSQGHLEIFGSAGGNGLLTFSQLALNFALSSGLDPVSAALKFSDGRSTVLFDSDGVGNGPETAWVGVMGMISNPPSSQTPYYSSVAWSVGSYTVEGLRIYGLICLPTSGGPYPLVIYNHGGLPGIGGDINGSVTAAGWTTPPAAAPDELGQCIDWAKRGWVVAMSSYRGESVNIASASPAFTPPSGGWKSDGAAELCLGEVTDVMALTDLVVNHAASISVGSPTQQVPLNTNGKVFMYGYSHGGCITYRAVEQGAPVTAFSAIEGLADMRLTYLNWTSNGQTQQAGAFASGAGGPGLNYYLPDASGVMGYNWRSPHYFASRGDLSIQKFKTMPMLIFQGDIDTLPNPQSPTMPSLNPVFLDVAAEMATDIGATNIFVGPSNVAPPTAQPCIAGAVGAPLPDNLLAPNASCPISFTAMDTVDPCVAGSEVPVEMPLCKVLLLPLAAPVGQPQQLHYFVVYHNMDHTNGGLTIKNTFNRFAELNFDRQPGCNGLEFVFDCASD